MFKRQFYALEHSNRGDSASSSSSSSLATASDGEGGSDVEDDGVWPASSHESDASSEEEVVEAEGATSAQRTVVSLGDETEVVAEDSDSDADGDTSDIELRESQGERKLSNQWAEAVDDDESERVLQKFEGSSMICVGESNKVFKCRVCPKVVCLSEESVEAHLASKGHARSLKQLAEGRLKVQLDSDGDEEEEGETHAERFARTITTAQEEKTVKRKRDTGRQRQRKRMKRKALLASKEWKSAEEVSLASQSTATQQLKGKVLGTKNKKTSSQIAAGPSVAKKRSQGNGSLGKHLPPPRQKQNMSSKTNRVDKPPKAKHRKVLSPVVSS